MFPRWSRAGRPGRPSASGWPGAPPGEEAYSLAISLLEFLDERRAGTPVKILATDLNEAALEKARAGVYLDNIEIDVSPERLRRFFVRTERALPDQQGGPRPVRVLAGTTWRPTRRSAGSTWSAAGTC